MCSRNELFMRSLECYFGVYFPSCFANREINTKIKLSWALKKFVTRVHTLFSISPWWGLQSDKFNNNDFKAIFIHSTNFQTADVLLNPLVSQSFIWLLFYTSVFCAVSTFNWADLKQHTPFSKLCWEYLIYVSCLFDIWIANLDEHWTHWGL